MIILKSLKLRTKNFIIRHFALFCGGRLKQYKSIYANKRCFVIGNGPSLKAEDLTTLYKNGEVSFAFNRIFQIFPQTPWRPTYFVSQDSLSLSTSAKEIEQISTKAKFIPIEAHWYEGIDIKGATYFHLAPNNKKDYSLFSDNIAKVIYNSSTVVYTAIQIAVYMGFKEIYLIGVDHHFHTTLDRTGKIHIDESAKDYFVDDYNKLRKGKLLPNVDCSTMAFETARKYAEAHGISIYNATRGGKLEVFPRVNFDSLW